jgi:hypothetical protein
MNVRKSRVLLSLATYLLALGGCATNGNSTVPGPPIIEEPSGLDLPCDPQRILAAVCQKCHTNPQRNGAPFPLVTYDDTQAIWKGARITSYMLPALQKGIMPLPPVTIAPADRAMLIAWLTAGAPPRMASDMCSMPPVSDPDASADALDESTEASSATVASDDGPDVSDGDPAVGAEPGDLEASAKDVGGCDSHRDASDPGDASSHSSPEEAGDAGCD